MKNLGIIALATLIGSSTSFSWGTDKVYDKWHQTKLERWLKDHNIPAPAASNRKAVYNTVDKHWNQAQAPYNTWEEAKLRNWLIETGLGAQEIAGHKKDQLVDLVKQNYHAVGDTADDFGNWILDTWTESQLKSFLDHHHIPNPTPRNRDSLLQAARGGYKTSQKSGKTTYEKLFGSWSDSDLKAWCDERGIPVPQNGKRDEVYAAMRKNSHSWVDSIRAGAQQVFNAPKDTYFDTYSDSDLKKYLDKQGVPIPRGSKKNELLALARKNRKGLGDSASEYYQAATDVAGDKMSSAASAGSSVAGSVGSQATDAAGNILDSVVSAAKVGASSVSSAGSSAASVAGKSASSAASVASKSVKSAASVGKDSASSAASVASKSASSAASVASNSAASAASVGSKSASSGSSVASKSVSSAAKGAASDASASAKSAASVASASAKSAGHGAKAKVSSAASVVSAKAASVADKIKGSGHSVASQASKSGKSAATVASNSASSASDEAADAYGAATSSAGNYATQASKYVADTADSIFSTWSESRLKSFLESRGVPVPQSGKVDELRSLVRENSHKAMKYAQGTVNAHTFESWSSEQLSHWLKDQNINVAKSAQKNRNQLIATARSNYEATEKKGSDLHRTLQAAAAKIKGYTFENWSESDLKSFLDSYGVQAPQGSNKDQLIATARKNSHYFSRGQTGPLGDSPIVQMARDAFTYAVNFIKQASGIGYNKAQETAQEAHQKAKQEL